MTPEEIRDIARKHEIELKSQMQDGEKYAPIKDYEGYFVTTNGRVFSCRKGYLHELKPGVNGGYRSVSLGTGCKRSKTIKVHRLVALAFIPNPMGYMYVNHKDENKLNNHVDNLEWCSFLYNVRYGTARERMIRKMKNHPSLSKPVAMYDKNGYALAIFPSMGEAGRFLGLSTGALSEVAMDRYGRRTCGGYVWREISGETTLKALFGSQIGKEGEE